jgi:DNA-binding CsgD family transcriptional regulator
MPARRLIALFGLVAFIILGLAALDVVQEPVFPPWSEILVDVLESVILVGAMGGVAWAVHGVIDLRDNQTAILNNIARSAAQGEAWRAQRHREIAAMGQAIEDQFRAWNLSVAEADVAGLMLKGASLKEIAIARETTEATIRQQAQAIYRKSGLSGRAELSAYFLESLFDQAEETARQRPPLSVISKDQPSVG